MSRQSSRLLCCRALNQSRAASSFVQKFNAAVDSLPMREAVRYKFKNVKWTAAHIKVKQTYS